MIQSKRNFMAALLGTAVLAPTCKLPTPANIYDHLRFCWTWYETKDILNAFPVRVEGVAARGDAPFTTLSDSRDRDLIRLNPVAARVWDLCDGRNSVETMVRKLTGDYEVSPSACATDVVLTLAAFKRRGLIAC